MRTGTSLPRQNQRMVPYLCVDDVPAYLVFHNSALEEIATRRPRSLAELAAVPGVGPAKLERYGDEVLAALAEQEVEQQVRVAP